MGPEHGPKANSPFFDDASNAWMASPLQHPFSPVKGKQARTHEVLKALRGSWVGGQTSRQKLEYPPGAFHAQWIDRAH